MSKLKVGFWFKGVMVKRFHADKHGQKIGGGSKIFFLLSKVDVKDPHLSLKELALLCILTNFTLMVAWSPEEAGRYLETYKIYENKPPG